MTAEYLRRNLAHAKSIGACSSLTVCLDRLAKHKRAPRWLVCSLKEAHKRASALPAELRQWRDAAPDSPWAGGKDG